MASTDVGDWILDPFSGSSTTGIAANLCGRRFAGIEKDETFCKLSKARREDINDDVTKNDLIKHIADLKLIDNMSVLHDDSDFLYGRLPFE